MSIIVLLLAAIFGTHNGWADEIRVAVASNFRDAMIEAAAVYEAGGSHRVTLIFGSTGKHFAQIVNGAPYDLLFAADRERPERLEQTGRAIEGSRFTYAIGRLALWSPRPGWVDEGGRVLQHAGFRHLAMANPELAPYGIAARETLQSLGYWETLRGRLVLGENVAQALQFVDSGGAELGFVAWPQLIASRRADTGSYWLVPESLHAPIAQQAVQLTDKAASRDFLVFMQSPAARAIIRDNGYRLP
jgi:molybdate transport system substrate-binding protein